MSRKMIVKEIWNDYPGADEGLNQAISTLRKLLNDDKKSVIETLPKTGYCFHGTISPDHIVRQRKSFTGIYRWVAVLFLLIVVFALGYYDHRSKNKIVRDDLSHEESIKAYRSDSKQTQQLRGTNEQRKREEGEADSRGK